MTTPTIDKAAVLLRDVEGLIRSPGALMLPAEARRCIRELARQLLELAVEVEKCKLKTQ